MNLNTSVPSLKKEQRLYNLDKPLIGLTGGVATGKSSVSELLRSKGLIVIDADKLVKQVYDKESVVKFVAQNFPGAVNGKKINFKKLREVAFSAPENLRKLENEVYSHLPEAFKSEVDRHQEADFFIYDVPLLFEKKLDRLVDFKVLVYCDRMTQVERLIERDRIKPELAEKILNEQMDIEEKKRHSDYVIDNNGDKKSLTREVNEFISFLLNLS